VLSLSDNLSPFGVLSFTVPVLLRVFVVPSRNVTSVSTIRVGPENDSPTCIYDPSLPSPVSSRWSSVRHHSAVETLRFWPGFHLTQLLSAVGSYVSGFVDAPVTQDYPVLLLLLLLLLLLPLWCVACADTSYPTRYPPSRGRRAHI